MKKTALALWYCCYWNQPCPHSSLQGSFTPKRCHLRWVSRLNLFCRGAKVWSLLGLSVLPHYKVWSVVLSLTEKPFQKFFLLFQFQFLQFNFFNCFGVIVSLIVIYLLITSKNTEHTWICCINKMYFQKNKSELLCWWHTISNLVSGSSASWMVKNMRNTAVNFSVSMASVITGGGMWSSVWFDLTNTANAHWQAKHTRRAERRAPGWGEGQGCCSNTVNPSAAEELKMYYMLQYSTMLLQDETGYKWCKQGGRKLTNGFLSH